MGQNGVYHQYQKIVRGVNRVRFTYRDNDAVNLVKELLKHQASDRLPLRVGGTRNTGKCHFFDAQTRAKKPSAPLVCASKKGA